HYATPVILTSFPTRRSSDLFDAMTASVVAVHTDAKKNGRPLVGLAFDSIGRYGHGGLLRERFIPRLVAADPEAYSDGHGGIDPRSEEHTSELQSQSNIVCRF